jgi:hypothetical protein
MPALEELRQEHDEVGVGPLIDAVVRDLVRVVASNYPPAVYAGTATWTAEAIEDLVQDVMVEWMLSQGQLAYILGTARTVGEFRALSVRTIRRALAHRRIRTVVDNLLDRCRNLLAAETFETIEVGGRYVYRRRGASPYGGDATDEQLRAAELLVLTVPRQVSRSGERAPLIYTTDQLGRLLLAVASSLPGGFTLADLDRIFGRVLTPWLAGSLVGDEAIAAHPSPELTPEDYMIVQDVTTRLLTGLDADQKAVLGLYLANASDTEIARVLGLRTRQAIIKRRAEIANVLTRQLGDLPSHVADTVVGGLAVALATSAGASNA